LLFIAAFLLLSFVVTENKLNAAIKKIIFVNVSFL